MASLSLSHHNSLSLHFAKLYASDQPWLTKKKKNSILCFSARPFKRKSSASATKDDESEPRELARLVMRSFTDKEPLVRTLNKYVRVFRTEHCFILFEELGRSDKWLQCLEVFRWMQKQRWYIADNGIYSKLISVMGKRGQTRMAMWLFSEMRNSGCRPDTSVYNSLITAHLHSRDKVKALEKAWGYFEKMKATERCKPSIVTYNILLRAFAQARKVEQVNSLFKDLEENFIAPDIYTYNGVMDAYGKLGMVGEMESVLAMMKDNKIKPDIITFNLLIDAYGKKQEFEKMEQVFKSLLRSKERATLPTFNSMIVNYGKARRLEKAESVFTKMTDMGYTPSFVTTESLLTMYGLCDCVSRARDVFNNLVKSGNEVKASTLNAMIEAYCLNGLQMEAHKLFESANSIGVTPNTATYKLLYKAFNKANMKEQVDILLKQMEKDGIEPKKMLLLEALGAVSSSESGKVSRKSKISSSSGERDKVKA